MKKRVIAVSGLLAFAAASAWAQNDVIASAGQASVTQSDVTTLLKNLTPDVRARLAADPARLDQLVRARLAQAVVFQEAKSKGWDQQPQVKRAVELVQRETVANSYLASITMPPADYPTDQDIQAAYEESKGAFTVPYSLHFAQIFIATPQGTDKATIDEARRKAEGLAKAARASGTDFGALAKANSQDKESAPQGGDMGFMPENALLPEIRKAADGMKPGDVSQPIQTVTGFHIVKLIETRPSTVRPLTDVKEEIRTLLRQQRAQQNAQAYLAKAVGPASLTINEEALKKALSAAQ